MLHIPPREPEKLAFGENAVIACECWIANIRKKLCEIIFRILRVSVLGSKKFQ